VRGPLISVAELRALLDDPELAVADTRWYLGEPDRGRAAYADGHVPGAVYVDLEHHLSASAGPGRHPLPDPFDFALSMEHLGIGAEHLVVAYDDRGGAVASRLWWMLRAQGHQRVQVLDGGWTAWMAAGMPASLNPQVPTPPARRIGAAPWPGTLDRDEVRSRIGDITLVDARSPDRYRGETEPIDPVAGHIPTAINLPYEDNLSADLRFREPDELRAQFAAAGVTADAKVVSYCGSGVTACHNLLAMEIAGIEGATLYPGSWSDWSTAGEEAATGP
jgi:thiosulfate/3-mercaptopyruvate sulfurtransferase